MSDPGHVGPRVDPGWWDFVRQVGMYLLAVFLVFYAALTPGHDIAFLVTALILFGLVPAERILVRKLDTKLNGGPAEPEGRRPPSADPSDD